MTGQRSGAMLHEAEIRSGSLAGGRLGNMSRTDCRSGLQVSESRRLEPSVGHGQTVTSQ